MSKQKVSKPRRRKWQISICLSRRAFDELIRRARLWRLPPTQYARAVLLNALGLWDEPLDRRTRDAKRIWGEEVTQDAG